MYYKYLVLYQAQSKDQQGFLFLALPFSFAFMVIDFGSGDNLRFFLTSQSGCRHLRTGNVLPISWVLIV